MATSDFLGLFTTPEQYQQAQRQAQEAQAIQYAKLDPMSQAQYGFYRAGQQIGGAIGGALGGEDPQLKLISMRQQLASQLDPSDPASYMKVAQFAAQSGDQQFATAIANAGRDAAVKVAQANKERQLAVPVDIQKAQMIPQIQDAIDQYSALPVSPERDRAIKLLQNQLRVLGGDANTKLAVPIQVANRIGEINRTLRTLKPEDPTYQDLIAERDQLQKSEKIPDAIQIARRVSELETQLSPDAGVVLPPQVRAGLEAELNNLKKQEKERNISFGTEAERKSKARYGKPYADLSPAEAGIIDKLVEESERAKASASKTEFNMGSTQAVEPKDWLKFSEFINKDPLMSRTSSILSDAPTAIQTIKNSTQNNFSSASLPAAIAKLTGEGKNMSNQDIERYTRTGGLDQRIAGDVVGFFTGKKTDVTKAQAEQFAVALYRGALLERKQFIQDQAESTGYSESPNYKKTIEQLDKKLGQFKLVTPKGSQNSSTPAPNPKDEALINKYLKKP